MSNCCLGLLSEICAEVDNEQCSFDWVGGTSLISETFEDFNLQIPHADSEQDLWAALV